MSACRCGLGGIWAAICFFLRALPLDVCFFTVLLIDGVSRLCLCVLLYLDPLRCGTMLATTPSFCGGLLLTGKRPRSPAHGSVSAVRFVLGAFGVRACSLYI